MQPTTNQPRTNGGQAPINARGNTPRPQADGTNIAEAVSQAVSGALKRPQPDAAEAQGSSKRPKLPPLDLSNLQPRPTQNDANGQAPQKFTRTDGDPELQKHWKALSAQLPGLDAMRPDRKNLSPKNTVELVDNLLQRIQSGESKFLTSQDHAGLNRVHQLATGTGPSGPDGKLSSDEVKALREYVNSKAQKPTDSAVDMKATDTSRNHRVSNLAVRNMAGTYAHAANEAKNSPGSVSPKALQHLRQAMEKYTQAVGGFSPEQAKGLVDKLESGNKKDSKDFLNTVADSAHNMRFGDSVDNSNISAAFDPNKTSDGQLTPRSKNDYDTLSELASDAAAQANKPGLTDTDKKLLQGAAHILDASLEKYDIADKPTKNGMNSSSTAEGKDYGADQTANTSRGLPADPSANNVSGTTSRSAPATDPSTQAGNTAPTTQSRSLPADQSANNVNNTSTANPGSNTNGTGSGSNTSSTSSSSGTSGGMGGDHGIDLNFDPNAPEMQDVKGEASTFHRGTQKDTALGTFNGSADAGAWANGSAGGDVGTEEDGTKFARGQVQAEAGVGVQGEASIEGKYGHAGVEAQVGAEVSGSAAGEASINPETGEFTVEGQAEAQATAADVEGNVGVNTANNEVSADVNGQARAGAGAEASGGITSTGASGEAGAFAGAEANAGGEVGVGDGAAKAGGEVGVKAGIGLEAGGHAGLEDGHLKFGGKLGGALGVGGKVEWNVDIDVNKVKDGAQKAAVAAGGAAEKAAGAVAGTAEKAAGAVAGTAEKAAGAVAGTAQKAAGAVVDTAEAAAAPVVDAAEEVGGAVVDVAEDVGEKLNPSNWF